MDLQPKKISELLVGHHFDETAIPIADARYEDQLSAGPSLWWSTAPIAYIDGQTIKQKINTFIWWAAYIILDYKSFIYIPGKKMKQTHQSNQHLLQFDFKEWKINGKSLMSRVLNKSDKDLISVKSGSPISIISFYSFISVM